MLFPDPDDALNVKRGVKYVFRFLRSVGVLIDKVNLKCTILTIFFIIVLVTFLYCVFLDTSPFTQINSKTKAKQIMSYLIHLK